MELEDLYGVFFHVFTSQLPILNTGQNIQNEKNLY